MPAVNLYLALIHYPVVDKNGSIIASAVTNLDLHDIARAARTYGARRLFVVTPLKEQQELADRIISHWVTGYGAEYNPKRRQALELIRIVPALDDVMLHIAAQDQGEPKSIATCARMQSGALPFKALRERVKNGQPHVLVFGTAWGLADTVFEQVDDILEPIRGVADYNHLSVRSAASIILDRLVGQE